MVGLQFISDTWQMEYKTVAEKVGVSKQTFQDWIKGRRKIPQQRLERLSDLFGVKEFDLFQKELTESEKIDIQIQYFRRMDVFDEVKVSRIDENGEEFTTSEVISQNKGIIDYLEESKETKLIDSIRKAINEDEYGGNSEVFQDVVKLLCQGKQEAEMMKALVYHLAQRNSMFGGYKPKYKQLSENGFLDDVEVFYQKHKNKFQPKED
ncbi:hypothetical protein BBG47_26020 [Paenibacillus sp. KS1]|uniref:helix-turn-helix domain-containing protein n=1 Tax=Paenibacillus sp. KS1 TaxID=1849249 RepID=UPI00080655F0|nr:helix-turn-helix transcriptional regulator [Paenibacillus sp. KS1]OBY76630.1 hypothetical protein BBG47_26020 [Paenibacillus sp. KS1]